MYALGRSTTHGTPEANRWRSISPCQRSNSSDESTAARGPDSFTMRRTPAACAASIAAHSCSTWSRTLAQARKSPSTPSQRPLERVAVGEVADGELDVVAEHARGLLAVADERAWLDAALAQLAYDVGADVAGRSCHQCSHRVPPLLGGMLALRRKTFAGS